MPIRSLEEIDADRAAAGITRKALYGKAGVHHSTYGRVLRGGLPNVKTLDRLEQALKTLLIKRRRSPS